MKSITEEGGRIPFFSTALFWSCSKKKERKRKKPKKSYEGSKKERSLYTIVKRKSRRPENPDPRISLFRHEKNYVSWWNLDQQTFVRVRPGVGPRQRGNRGGGRGRGGGEGGRRAGVKGRRRSGRSVEFNGVKGEEEEVAKKWGCKFGE